MELQGVDRIIDSYGGDPSQLLGVLQDIQGEVNWLPAEALQRVAERMGVPVARVYRLASFYQALSLEPRGRHIATVCMGTACHVRGAPRLVEKLERDLGIQAGGTTPDHELTLETVNCVGACALGPLVILDGSYHGNMTSSALEKLMKPYRKPGAAAPKKDGQEAAGAPEAGERPGKAKGPAAEAKGKAKTGGKAGRGN